MYLLTICQYQSEFLMIYIMNGLVIKYDWIFIGQLFIETEYKYQYNSKLGVYDGSDLLSCNNKDAHLVAYDSID